MRLVFIVPFIALTVLAMASPPESPTFNRDVLPILQRNCQTCHRPGEIGPMSLLTYADARPWAKAIKEQVLTRSMPPWFADTDHARFANDRRLSERDIRSIIDWVDGEAPEGDPRDKPAPVTWRNGWNIRPDKVFQMRTAYAIPEKGTLDYVYIVLPTGFTRDVWVKAAEVRPSARDVVHHVLAVVRPPGSQWMKEARPYIAYAPPTGQPDSSNPQLQPANMSYEYLAGYSPGMQPERFDGQDSAKLIPAGSDIVLQLHYTPNGKRSLEDVTKLGLTLAETPPRKRFMSAVAASSRWEIAPGDPNAEGRASLVFGEPVTLVSIQPHMHVRGKDMTIGVLYPNGNSETLLRVVHYDFRWQIIYHLAKPLALPQGTRIEVVGHWDNSVNNPYNPDPTATVRFGYQSFEEMLSAAMGVLIDR